MIDQNDSNSDNLHSDSVDGLHLNESAIHKNFSRIIGKKSKSFNRKKRLKTLHTCEQCKKEFSYRSALKKHLATHTSEKPCICEECGKAFKTRSNLGQHQKIHLKDGNQFHCSQCDFTSENHAAVHAHRQIHPEGCLICEICGMAYGERSNLTKHMRVHDPRRPYSCSYPDCPWRFKTEMMCHAHIKAHNTQGQHQCGYCGFMFRHKCHLRRHERVQHGVVFDRRRVRILVSDACTNTNANNEQEPKLSEPNRNSSKPSVPMRTATQLPDENKLVMKCQSQGQSIIYQTETQSNAVSVPIELMQGSYSYIPVLSHDQEDPHTYYVVNATASQQVTPVMLQTVHSQLPDNCVQQSQQILHLGQGTGIEYQGRGPSTDQTRVIGTSGPREILTESHQTVTVNSEVCTPEGWKGDE